MIRSLCLLLTLLALTLAQKKHVHKKPRFTVTIKNLTLTAGENGYFECAAIGTPAPEMIINTFKDGVKGLAFPKAHADVRGESKARRVFKPVTKEDEGWYRCHALNQKKLVFHDAYLSVKEDKCRNCKAPYVCIDGVCGCERDCSSSYEPVCSTECKTYFNQCQFDVKKCKEKKGSDNDVMYEGYCKNIAVPRMKIKSKKIKVKYGDSFVLSVKVSGNPAPEVTWFRKERSSDRKVGAGEKLTLSTNRGDADGIYYAVGVNCMTNKISSDNVNVIVEEPTETTPSESPTAPDENLGELNFQPVDTVIVPPMPSGPKICNMVGSSHFTSFDGWRYEFRGDCSYVFSMDCEYARWFIYGRLMQCDTGYCLESTTVYYNRKSIQLLRGWVINYRGTKYAFKEGVPFSIDGIVITFDGLLMKLYFGDVAMVWDGYTGIQIVVSKGAITCGLCGNNDEAKANDVDQVRTSRVGSIDNPQLRFIDSWKVDSRNVCGAPYRDTRAVAWQCTDDENRRADYRQCRQLYNVAEFVECNSKRHANLRFFYDSCMEDACYGETPLPGYSKGCLFAQAMANQCSLAGSTISESWKDELGCGSRAARQTDIVSVGCPQQILPFI